jgi:hypothetical protein
MSFTYSQTADGLETAYVHSQFYPLSLIIRSVCRLQVNYLSTVLFVLLLLPRFAAPASQTRIVLLTSESHAFIRQMEEADSPSIFERLNDPEHCAK